MKQNRTSGVLMHISSLPGNYSVGSFGEEAKQFVEYLVRAGFHYWQVLPFCMADECNSPYKSLSAFGANPYFIDLPTLRKKGLLTDGELEEARQKTPYRCEYDRLYPQRLLLLRKAASRMKDREAVKTFLDAHDELNRAALFLAKREANRDRPWVLWDRETYSEETLFFWQFVQYEFYTQWKEIKTYANRRGVEIIGDLPIYVAHDSADVWSNQKEFLLDEKGYPKQVAGVPPDYFCKDGQLWGNPIYDWKSMEKDGFSWWKKRLTYALELFDGLRIDHFRGLESYWSIPYGAGTAREGCWKKGPGKALVDAIKEVSGDHLIIAEDLGDITDGVRELLDYSGFPGMRVFQFAFLGDPDTPHLPHQYCRNCVAYSGTHDNNTLLGYVWEMNGAARERMQQYCRVSDRQDWSGTCVSILETLLASHAGTVIVPVQDLLGFGADTRMNTPGTDRENWAFRLSADQLRNLNAERFAKLNDLYGRNV